MATQTILQIAFFVVVSPIIWWLMWRENFDGMRTEWRFKRVCKTRERVSAQQFYERYYQDSGLQRDTILRLLSLHADFFSMDPGLIRPGDNYSDLFNVDVGELVGEIESFFGMVIPEAELASIDGSFDSIARYVDRRLAEPK